MLFLAGAIPHLMQIQYELTSMEHTDKIAWYLSATIISVLNTTKISK